MDIHENDGAMSEHESTERIHDYVDGLLDAAERRAVEAHVAVCAECAEQLDRTQALVGALRSLPDHAEPEHDLWPGILERLEAAGGARGPGSRGGGGAAWGGDVEADVVPLPVGPAGAGRLHLVGGRRSWTRRVSVTLPQLYAAGIAIALLSGAAAWFVAGGARSGAPLAQAPAEVPVEGFASARLAENGYEATVAELEEVLQQGRAFLHPETLRTLEESLATIDAAIAEAEQALVGDPGSELLQSLLATRQRAKVRVLRNAATSLSPRT